MTGKELSEYRPMVGARMVDHRASKGKRGRENVFSPGRHDQRGQCRKNRTLTVPLSCGLLAYDRTQTGLPPVRTKRVRKAYERRTNRVRPRTTGLTPASLHRTPERRNWGLVAATRLDLERAGAGGREISNPVADGLARQAVRMTQDS